MPDGTEVRVVAKGLVTAVIGTLEDDEGLVDIMARDLAIKVESPELVDVVDDLDEGIQEAATEYLDEVDFTDADPP